MFSNGSWSSISLAMVTPSLVMVGGPNFLSSTTLRPRGPSVILTASASLSTPRRSDERASSLYETCFAAIGLILPLVGAVVDDGQDVGLAQDQQLVVLVLDLGARVLGEQDAVAGLELHRDSLAVVRHAAGADRDHLALLRLFL